jgi:hypothetical protein
MVHVDSHRKEKTVTSWCASLTVVPGVLVWA